MVNRSDKNTARKYNLSDEAVTSPQHSFSSRQPKLTKNSVNDDLIVSLAGAYENKRARQVNEWERMRGVHRMTL